MGADRPTSHSSSQPTRLPLIAGLAAASIWGGMYVVSDVVLEAIPPFSLLSLRLLLGILTFALILGARRVRIDLRGIAPLLLTGFVGYGISLGLQFVGTRLSTAANGALITSATPAFVALFAAWILREHITRRQAAALLIATIGVLLVVDLRDASLASDTFLGNLALLGAGITWGLYSVLVRRDSGRGWGVLELTFVVLFGGLPAALPFAALELSAGWPGPLTSGVLLGVLYLGIVSTAGAMFLWNYAFARLPASTAALAFFAQPLVGALLSVVLLGEQLGVLFFVGGTLILLGTWLAGGANQRISESRNEIR